MFSCYTLVYVCKTEVHATIQFAFNSELSFSPTKGILRNYEAVFISKILFTVQIQLCLLVIQLCPFVIQLSSCHSIMFVCLSIMSSCRSITISHHACLTFNYLCSILSSNYCFFAPFLHEVCKWRRRKFKM